MPLKSYWIHEGNGGLAGWGLRWDGPEKEAGRGILLSVKGGIITSDDTVGSRLLQHSI